MEREHLRAAQRYSSFLIIFVRMEVLCAEIVTSSLNKTAFKETIWKCQCPPLLQPLSGTEICKSGKSGSYSYYETVDLREKLLILPKESS